MRLLLLVVGVGTLIMLGRYYSASVEQQKDNQSNGVIGQSTQDDISNDSEFSHFQTASRQSLSSRFDNRPSAAVPNETSGVVDLTSTETGSAFRTSTYSVGRNDLYASAGTNVDEYSNSNLPANARNVRHLSRAYYELPPVAADLLEKFFSLKKDSLVETKIIGKKTDSIVTFEVTTDVATQKSLGNFLLSVYPVDKALAVGDIPDGKATKVAVR